MYSSAPAWYEDRWAEATEHEKKKQEKEMSEKQIFSCEQYMYLHRKNTHLLRVNNVYFAMWTVPGTCISSSSSQDLLGNHLELQRHLLVIIISCYRRQAETQNSLLCIATFSKQHWYSSFFPFSHKSSLFPYLYFSMYYSLFPILSIFKSQTCHLLQLHGSSSLLSSLFSGVKTNTALCHLILLISDIL